MTDQPKPNHLEAFDDFLAVEEGASHEPRQYIVTVKDQYVDIWADGAFIDQQGELRFYRETIVTEVKRGVVSETKTWFRKTSKYGEVRREEERLEIVGYFPHGAWTYYYLVDDKTGYGGIDPDLLKAADDD